VSKKWSKLVWSLARVVDAQLILPTRIFGRVNFKIENI